VCVDGLSEGVMSTLGAMVAAAPAIEPEVRERLLDASCAALLHSPYAAWAKRHKAGEPTPTPKTGASADGAPASEAHQSQVVLALRTLGTFGAEFADETSEGRSAPRPLHVLSAGRWVSFVADVAPRFLGDGNVLVRETAATTCCALLATEGPWFEDARGSDESARDAVLEQVRPSRRRSRRAIRRGSHPCVPEQVLAVAVADPDPVARVVVLETLLAARSAPLQVRLVGNRSSGTIAATATATAATRRGSLSPGRRASS